MESKGKKHENEEELEKFQFQQKLSKWFQNQGIIADLRSHLRYLMITALQKTQGGTKLKQKNSLKTQALNLLIAEYLFRLECHYTLSIFNSEMPLLSEFSCLAPFFTSSFQENSSMMSFFEKQLPKCKNNIKKIFKENEIQEIFNVLGFSFNSEEIKFLKTAYFKSCDNISLLELFFSLIINMSSKLSISNMIERDDKDTDKDDLSVQWSLEVKHLLREQIEEPQFSVFYNSLVSITKNELQRILEKKHLQHLEALRDRENRIQEHLLKYEKDIIIRLSKAKNDLILRKNLIDKKFMEKQKVLFKMILEWKSKHEDIVEVSKQFYIKHDENKILQKTLGEMENKIKYYELQKIKQNEKINKLQNQIKSLINKMEAITESKNTLRTLFEELINKENGSYVKIPEKANMEQRDLENCLLETSRPPVESLSISPINIQDEIINASSEELLLKARSRLQVLAKESLNINKNYWECKNKYCDNTDSETSKNSSVESATNNINSLEIKCYKKSPKIISSQKKFKLNENKKKFEVINNFSNEEMKEKNKCVEELENLLMSHPSKKNSISKEKREKKSLVKQPSQRQLKNREYFFKNKQLLQTLEDQQLMKELIATTTTSFSTDSSSETLNDRLNTKLNSLKIENLYQDPLLSPETDKISIYCGERVLQTECKSV